MPFEAFWTHGAQVLGTAHYKLTNLALILVIARQSDIKDLAIQYNP